MGERHWETALSVTTEDGISIRGYDLIEMIGRIPFPSVLYLLYTGELPTPSVAKMIDALMVASIDHGAGAPSALAARTAISGGATLGAGAAAGLLTLGNYHGAAVEDAMEAIQQVVGMMQAGQTADQSADQVVQTWRAAKRRIAGFGHRQHKAQDPRLTRLFGLADELGISGEHVAAARAIEGALERNLGRTLPINIDGLMAAILLEINFPTTLANALFMVSRIVGIIAHAHEEQTAMPPMRRIDPVDHGYSGISNRNLEGASG